MQMERETQYFRELEKRYFEKFHEYFTIHRENNLSQKQIFEQIEKCIKTGKKYKEKEILYSSDIDY